MRPHIPKSKSKTEPSEFNSRPPNKKRKLNTNRVHSSTSINSNPNSNSNSDSVNYNSNECLSLSDTETESNNNNKKKNESESNNSNNAPMDSVSSYVNMNSVVLKRASPVFDAMLNDNNPQHSMQEQKTKEIVIYSNSVQTVKDMCYFMCTNKLAPDASVYELLPLAHMYQLSTLVNLCCEKFLHT
jgi:hypothetical protein